MEQASMKRYRNKQILVHESHLNLSIVILPPFCFGLQAMNNNSYGTGIYGWDAESYIGDAVSKAHIGDNITFNDNVYYTIRMFPPAIDIIPTSLAVVYSNGTYIN